jgi:hypothetical protein
MNAPIYLDHNATTSNALGSREDRQVFNASPVVIGSRLLIRSDSTLWCIGK